MNLKTLFLLSNADVLIFEIKHQDIQTDDLTKVFYWFLYDLNTDQLQRLHFVSMSKDGTEQQRVFKEGKLQFNEEIARFESITGRLMDLMLMPKKELPEGILGAVQHFING